MISLEKPSLWAKSKIDQATKSDGTGDVGHVLLQCNSFPEYKRAHTSDACTAICKYIIIYIRIHIGGMWGQHLYIC